MTTVTLKVNEKTKKGQVFMEFLNQFISDSKIVEVVKEPNSTTLKSMEEGRTGKVIKAENVKELIKKLKD
jgi:hypothetical protein